MQDTPASYSAPQYEPRRALLEQFCRSNHTLAKSVALPPPWPSTADAMNWTSENIPSDCVTHLSEGERDEILGACKAYCETQKSLDDLNRTSFPLPLMAGKLAATRRGLHNGAGFQVLRGLDLSSCTMREVMVAFAGLASHVSQSRGRQAGGRMIVHVTDMGQACAPAPYRNSSLHFHTDPVADVVAMFVLKSAAHGGRGVFCPVASIYNELAVSQPHLLSPLAMNDWPFDQPTQRQGEISCRPVMFLGAVSAAPEMLFSRGALIRSPHGFRPPDLPSVTAVQNAALDAVHFTASSLAYHIDYQDGDMLFFNNRRILHGREAFHDELPRKRHMLRLWLRDEELAGTPLPPLDKLWSHRFAECHKGEEGIEADRWPLLPDGS